MKIMKCKIEGEQILLHNRQLADPLNEFCQLMKPINGKRAKDKTEKDYMELARLEFFGGLYLNEKEQIIIPSGNIKAMLGEAAKLFREGPKCKPNIEVLEHSILKFSGPKNSKERWKKKLYLRKPVKQGQIVIVRTRPIFHNWSIQFEVYYDDEQVDSITMEKWLNKAAAKKGLGDGRPEFGRFRVLEVSHSEELDNESEAT